MKKTMQFLAVTLVLIVVASSCSSAAAPVVAGDQPADLGTTSWGEGVEASTFPPDVVATVDSLVAAHGADSLVAMLYVLERGYTYEQLAKGVADGVVADDGSFSDGTEPDGAPGGVILLPDGEGEGAAGTQVDGTNLVLKPAAKWFQPLDSGQQKAERLRRATAAGLNSNENGDRLLELAVAGLARDGYSLEQITDAIVFGTGIPFPQTNFGNLHLCLIDLDGSIIQPATPISKEGNFCGDWTIAPGGLPRADRPPEDQADAVPAAPEQGPIDAVAFVGSVTQGGLESTSDNLITVTFEALVEGDNVTIVADYSAHIWLKGGPTDPPFEDQNCGATQKLQLRGEGPAGSPTTISLLVVSSAMVDQHGAICFNRAAGESEERPLDTSFWTPEPGSVGARFQGQVNGLGIDGTLKNVPIQANIPN